MKPYLINRFLRDSVEEGYKILLDDIDHLITITYEDGFRHIETYPPTHHDEGIKKGG